MSKFIKDISGETPDVETYLYVKDYISKYQMNIEINSKALKAQIIEINTLLLLEAGVIATLIPVISEPFAFDTEKWSVLTVWTTWRILPPATDANDKFPEASVTRACPDDPSDCGSLNSTSLAEGAFVGTATETELPPECTSLIFPVILKPPLLLLMKDI